MFVRRDKELEVKEDFKLNVIKGLAPTQSCEAVSFEGKILGWIVKEKEPLKILIAGKDLLDNQEHILKLHSVFDQRISVYQHNIGEESASLHDRAILDKYKIIYVPNPDEFTIDELLLLYMQVKSDGIRVLFSLPNGTINEVTGLSVQSAQLT